MAAPTYAYTPTDPAMITKALGDVFASMESGAERFNRSANTNVIVAVSAAQHLTGLEKTLDAFSLVHPSRFFVVYIDDSLSDLSASISARCHGLSRSEHACSEVVRIGVPRGKLWLVPSVIRGHFMVGTPAELYLADGAISRELVDTLAPLADLVIYDSEDFARRLDIVSETARLCSNLIDLEWIELGPWRDEIKSAFAKVVVREHMGSLREILIRATGGTGDIPPFRSLLLGGWIAHRLGLNHLLGRHGGLYAHPPWAKDRQVALRFEGAKGAAGGVVEVLFRFEVEGTQREVRFVRNGGLETFVDLGRKLHWSRPLDAEDREGLIRRFFLIGESTANYNAALRLALHLRQIE